LVLVMSVQVRWGQKTKREKTKGGRKSYCDNYSTFIGERVASDNETRVDKTVKGRELRDRYNVM
jgi:hypothetical protein